jgi:hypothetical protein
MRRILKTGTKIFLCLALCVLALTVANAQPPGDPATAPDIPITGIEILIALGGILGIKKLIARKKSN